MLRRFLARVINPVLPALFRWTGMTDPWERIDARFPLRLLGAGARYEFEWYFEGESTVPAGDLHEIRSWLRGCRYVRDPELFHEADYWQHPRTFEQLKRGDCEDFALWAWRKMVEIGMDADLVIGRCCPPATPGGGHAWIILRRDGDTHVIEPVSAGGERWMRPLDEARAEYVPHFGVTPTRERYIFAGWVLDKGAAPAAAAGRGCGEVLRPSRGAVDRFATVAGFARLRREP